MEIYRSKFGKRLEEALRETGVSQTQLAARLGVKDSTVSRWKNGKDFPVETPIEDICQALGVPDDYFGQPEQIIHQDPLPEWAQVIEDKLQAVMNAYEERLKTDKDLAQLDREVRFLREQNRQILSGNALLSKLLKLPAPIQLFVRSIIERDSKVMRRIRDTKLLD